VHQTSDFREVDDDAVGGSRTEAMRQAAASLFGKLSQSVDTMVQDQKAAGATIVEDIARAAFHAADDLEKSTPDAARLVRKAATGVERVATNLRTEDISQIFGNLRAFGRAQPLAFLGSAVLGGFIIARSVRSGRFTAAMQGSTAVAPTIDADGAL
jgi:hypothetical protein